MKNTIHGYMIFVNGDMQKFEKNLFDAENEYERFISKFMKSADVEEEVEVCMYFASNESAEQFNAELVYSDKIKRRT